MLVIGCTTSDELPPVSQIKPTVAAEGSLANEKLISDTTAALVELAKIPEDSKIIKFVIQQPVGTVGQRAWREMWIVSSDSNPIQFLITFREAGLDAADFKIQQM